MAISSFLSLSMVVPCSGDKLLLLPLATGDLIYDKRKKCVIIICSWLWSELNGNYWEDIRFIGRVPERNRIGSD